MARPLRDLSHHGEEEPWHVGTDFKLGLVSNGMVVQREQAPGRLDLAVCMTPVSPPSEMKLRLLGPTVAAAVCEAIRKDTGVISWLHWPRLVSIDEMIVGKTSLSSFALPVAPGEGEKRAVVMDMSVNCFAPVEPPSTSLLSVLGVEVDLVLLRERVLESIDWYYAEWERGMNVKLVRRMEPTISWMGKQVRIRTSRQVLLSGRAVGLREDGSLLLRQAGRSALRAVAPERVEHVAALP